MINLFLSHLTLNPESRAVQRDLGNRYNLHRTVMRGFPDNLPKERDHPNFQRILYRLDQQPRTGLITLLVQSTIAPDWSTLPNSYLAEADRFALQPRPNPAIKQITTADWQLQSGRLLHFRLAANPTKRLSSGKGNKPGKRVELYKDEDILDWLEKRAEMAGFTTGRVQIQPQPKIKGWKPLSNNKKRPITVQSVILEGTLQIREPERFTQALADGIGPAKAFGCGLLSLAPA